MLLHAFVVATPGFGKPRLDGTFLGTFSASQAWTTTILLIVVHIWTLACFRVFSVLLSLVLVFLLFLPLFQDFQPCDHELVMGEADH